MTSKNTPPTPFPDVNDIVQVVLERAQRILGSHFISMYLDGSLTSGDFDEASDIDFVAVTDQDIAGELFTALQAMHDRIAAMDSPWAIQLEGSYISRHAIRRYDPGHALHPNLERGSGERLKMAEHDQAWAIHRYVLRERGITLTGPAPKTLIDPVSPDELRQSMLPLLNGWATHLLDHPQEIQGGGYQSYVVLSMCRILYTLQFGEVVSKQKAAGWAVEMEGGKWRGLIERAWVGRQHGELTADPEDVNQTLDFIRYTLETSQQV